MVPTPIASLDRSGWPEWLGHAINFVSTSVKGLDWDRIVVLYVELERGMGFLSPAYTDASHKLKTEHRPAEVKAFMKYGRDYRRDAGISDLAEYADSWRMWWQGMQPAWRKAEGLALWPLSRAYTAGSELWVDIKRAGTNGFLLVILTLVWWDLKAKSAEERRELASAKEDVLWVLGEMVGGRLFVGTKRASDDAMEMNGPRKKYVLFLRYLISSHDFT
ncbi:hypothetical protein BD410DRAFT_735403 [Rickenella mellea]|uniref:Uncharacterized protein n=1 Tax=Rickenella mellea TaxID=50990 RepID=A0A4Y7PDR8_9AGAM|nr:hypothetical protein BD410DRAFT_735403 [Rickenella mellea]